MKLKNYKFQLKGPSDFVSSADKNAEKTIIQELLKSKKKYSIITEEIWKNY